MPSTSVDKARTAQAQKLLASNIRACPGVPAARGKAVAVAEAGAVLKAVVAGVVVKAAVVVAAVAVSEAA